MIWLLAGAAISLGLVAWILLRIQTKYYIAEYLFFVRWPTFFGLFLFLFPVLGPRFLPSMLTNIFVMTPVGAFFTGVAAAHYAWAAVYTLLLTWHSIPARCGVPWRRDGQWLREAGRTAIWLARDVRNQGICNKRPYRVISNCSAILSLILCAPLLWQVVAQADGARWHSVLAVSLGVAIAFNLRYFAGLLGSRLVRSIGPAKPWNPRYAKQLAAAVGSSRAGLVQDIRQCFRLAPALGVVHKRAALYAFLSIACVLFLVWLYNPVSEHNEQLPAIVLLLYAMLMLTWFFGLIGFLFDKDRVPLTLILLLLAAILQFFVANHHVYRTLAWPNQRAVTASTALAARRQHQQNYHAQQPNRPLVAIAASGGGIRAALWTAHVLEQLEAAIPGFHNDMALVSSVSGGSVGHMYYLDRQFVAPTASGDTASSAAGQSSLAASVWGITFLEVPRLLLGDLLNPRDRGWAQEVRWSCHLNQKDMMISGLAPGVGEGRYPLPIFNSCLQETGQRYLLSPARIKSPRTDLSTPTDSSAATSLNQPLVAPFRAVVQDLQADMQIVTAARLSASFPYISPTTSAQTTCLVAQPENQTRKYHAADGGYYDNSGLLTAIEVLDRFLEDCARSVSDQEGEAAVSPPINDEDRGTANDPDPPIPASAKPSQIALIEIRAAPGNFSASESPVEDGLLNTLLGPLHTAFSVVFRSQTARSDQEIKWLAQLWRQRNKVELKHFVFYLSGGPLSWHLTKDEKADIKAHLPGNGQDPSTDRTIQATAAHNLRTLEALQAFMQP